MDFCWDILVIVVFSLIVHCLAITTRLAQEREQECARSSREPATQPVA